MSIASKLTKLETDITNAYSAVNTKGGTIPTNKNTENLIDSINSIKYIPNVYKTNFTLDTHQSTNVKLCTLPDYVYSHINDTNFSVTMRMINFSNLQVNDDYFIYATNNSSAPTQSSQIVHGVLQRKASANLVQNNWCYYPPNSTDNKTSLGGFGKIWHDGNELKYKSNSYFLGAGTYEIIISW